MASSPITSWQMDGETVETVADFVFLGSKITVDDDCSHEIKRQAKAHEIRILPNSGETVETVADFVFLGSKITADGDCSHEIKRHLLPGRKVMTNLDSIFNNRDITLPTYNQENPDHVLGILWIQKL